MQVIYDKKGSIDALNTAFLAYRVKNNSFETLSLGSMVYFGTTGGNLCALVLKPLVYDAATGKRLDLKTSYEYTSGRFVLSDVMPTVEIPANSEVYIAIPFVSVDDGTNYVPGLINAKDENFEKGKNQNILRNEDIKKIANILARLATRMGLEPTTSSVTG